MIEVNNTVLGLVAAAVPLLIIGFFILRRLPWIFAFFVALLAVGLGYLETTGAIREFGHNVRTVLPEGIVKHKAHEAEPAAGPAMAPAETPADGPAMAPASPPAEEPAATPPAAEPATPAPEATPAPDQAPAQEPAAPAPAPEATPPAEPAPAQPQPSTTP